MKLSKRFKEDIKTTFKFSCIVIFVFSFYYALTNLLFETFKIKKMTGIIYLDMLMYFFILGVALMLITNTIIYISEFKDYVFEREENEEN